MAHITVRIDPGRVLFIEADPQSFGEVFAAADDFAQAAILQAMFTELRKQGVQRDFIQMKLRAPEFADLREDLAALIAPNEE